MALFSTYCFGNSVDKLSTGLCAKDATIGCLRDNFDNLYRDDYSLFWEILRNAANKAAQCEYLEDTTAFLTLVKLEKGNAEVNEFFSRAIEQLCIEKTKCFFNALLGLDSPTRVLIFHKLRTPLFVDESEIDRVFLEARSNEKYNKLSDSYFVEKKLGK